MNTENHYRETDLGNISIHLCGEYDPQRAYEYLDAVEFGGGSYICAIEYGKTITGIAPEPTKNTEYWHINSIPGTMTPEYIAMHDRVVNLSEQVEADAEEVRTAEQNVSGMELNVTQMQEQTRQAAEAAEQSKDSAAGYAASADASRQAAEESKQNIDAQVTGFDSHVAEKTSEAESNIESVRIAANKAIIAQQEQSVNEVTRAGIEAISTAQAAAQTATEKAQAAATSEKNAAASEAAAKLSEENATKMAEQVATDKEQIAHDRTAVENAKQEMAGSVAQIEQNTQGISELKSDLTKIATFDNYYNEIILDKNDCNDSYDSTYVNNGYIGETGKFSANSSYRTFYYQVTESSEIAVEESPDGIYCSVAVFNENVSVSNFVSRYRNNDGNLPTTTNRLSVSSGQWLAISYAYSSSEERNFYLYTGKYNIITGVPTATDEIAKSVADKIRYDYRTVSKTETSMVIKIGKLKYEFNKYVNSTIRANLWRTNACYVADSEGNYHTIWLDSDSDGIVKIKGESGFIGGYHGDETQTLFRIFIDGVEYDDSSIFTEMRFNEIVIYAESDVYHCNTSATPDVIAFKRNKIVTFNSEGYAVENYWVAQENLTCEIAYIGMLSVENEIIKGVFGNYNHTMFSSDNNGIDGNNKCTDVKFITNYGNIGIKMSDYSHENSYKGTVSKYTERMKAYMSCFTSSSQGGLNVGDVIRGKALTYFN